MWCSKISAAASVNTEQSEFTIQAIQLSLTSPKLQKLCLMMAIKTADLECVLCGGDS
jgi:hypothetical protein